MENRIILKRKEIEEKKKFANEQVKYWEKNYQKAKENDDTFYMHSYLTQIHQWLARYEIWKEILEENDKN